MKYVFVWIKGVLMGMCDVIPGVSGGTIAFITGIYDELLDALHGFNMQNLYLLSKGHFREVWKKIHGNFLFSLFFGIVIAIATLASVVTYLLDTYPSFVFAFFSGLILASVALLWYMIRSKKWIYSLGILFGVGIGFAVTSLPSLSLGDGLLSLFVSGAIAIIAMILPGISGSYILLILGKYSYVLGLVSGSVDALRQGLISDVPFLPLLVFVGGIVIGLLVFSRVLWWIKEHYHDWMVVVLMGFMLGAMKSIWPRKETITTYTDSHGIIKPLIQQNVLWPDTMSLLYCIGFALIGIGLLFTIHYVIYRYSKK